MSANNTLGIDEDNSDVKEDSLPTTTSLLDKSKSLFGNSSNAPAAPVKDSDAEAIPSGVTNGEDELMDTSDAPSAAIVDSSEAAEESFEKKTISMDTTAATANSELNQSAEDPVENMDEGSENGENGNATEQGNNSESREEPVDDAGKVGVNDSETLKRNEDVDAEKDEEAKTDDEFEVEDEEEEEVPKKKPKRTVVDDDETSDDQTLDVGSADQIDSVEDDSAPGQEIMDASLPFSSVNELKAQDNQDTSIAPLRNESSVSNHQSEGAPEEEEVIADESTEEAQNADGTEGIDDTEEVAVGVNDLTVNPEERTDNITATIEPTSSRSTRSKRTSTAAPTPTSSATPKRATRGRQSLANDETMSQGRKTPARRGASSRAANGEEEHNEHASAEDNQVDVGETEESTQNGESAETEQTPKRSGRGKRSVTATPVVPTPRSTRGRGRKSEATEEPEEPSVEAHGEEASVGASTRTPRKRNSTVNANDEARQEDSTETSEPTTSTSRRSARARVTAKSAPVTPATNKRTPARGRKKEVSITEETADELKEPEETPVVKKGGRRKSAPASGKKTDEHDPYDIDTEMEHHPEPLKNIHMEVQSFGTVKYAKTGASGSKYSQTEKAAESRVTELQTTPEGKNKRSLADMTPGKEKQKRPSTATGGRKSRAKKEPTKVDDVVMEDLSLPDSVETPTASNRARKRKSEIAEVLTPPAKRDQNITLKVLNDEEQLLADHPDDDNAPHAPGARVYAIFQKTFYPAVILSERDGLGRYKLQFTADNVVKDVPNSGVIPLRALIPGKTAFYNDDEVRLDSTPNDISAGEWAKGKLRITMLDGEGEPTEETKNVDWNEISFDQAEWRDYVKALEQNATAIVKSNITTISEASRVRKATATPQILKPKSRKKKTEDAAPSRETSTSPIDADELLPMKPEAIGTNIFSDKVFILTSASRSCASNVSPMFKKQNLKTFIEQNGGKVTENLNNFEELYPGRQLLLISDTYYRTHKYLAALARAIPCVSNTWLKVCGEKGECVDYEDYVLPAGASIFGDCEDMPAPKNPSELLTGRKIYVHSTHSVREVTQLGPGGTFVEIWKPILELLGAEVVDADWETLKGSDVTFDIALVDGTAREEVMEYAESIGASRVTSEWVIQTIILSRAPDPAGHSKFDPYRLHHRNRH